MNWRRTPFPDQEGKRVFVVLSYEEGWDKGDLGVSLPKGPFSFWIRDTVTFCGRVFLNWRNSWQNYSPWWSITFPSTTCSLHCKQHQCTCCCLRIFDVYHALMSVSVLWIRGQRCLCAALHFGRLNPILTDWDVTATIGLYNTVHKSSLCECTFDKVYLFICKHLIRNRQYI